MEPLQQMPFLLLITSLIVLWFSAWIGVKLHKPGALQGEDREEFGIVLGAALTLLGLIIGFTFSMAVTRYDQRKNLEEEEANAIGTEYVRADLLPAASAADVQVLLTKYLAQRILFYETRDPRELERINSVTSQLQAELWSAIKGPALAQQTPVVALAVSGMNDVLNSQGYTQAAWLNRIPPAAWVLMAIIAICANVLLGYGWHQSKGKTFLLVVMPLLLAVSFFLVADIDSPRRGLIRVIPQNLLSLKQSLH